MRSALVAAELALLVGCAFPDGLVRRRAATDFGCPVDEIVVHHQGAGWLARGCKKEADYVVQDSQATRSSEIRKAAFDERPSVPVDRTASAGSVGAERPQ